jgi:hypothetical protein
VRRFDWRGDGEIAGRCTGVRRTIADSFIVGFRWALTLAAALSFLGALTAWLAIENRSHRRSGAGTLPG